MEKLSDKLREYRVVSISTLMFLSYLTHTFLEWVMTSNPTELGQGVAVTGIMGSLAAMYKFVFQFAVAKQKPEDDPRI